MGGTAKYWVGICYPENMRDDWKASIGDLLQVPYAYCIHDKGLELDEDETRKVHVHIILAMNNTTTEKHVRSIFNKLSMPGRICCPGAMPIINIEHMYKYLIHDTEDSRKKNKYLFNKEERITGNNFDIGAYVQIGLEEKERMLDELEDLIYNNGFTNYAQFHKCVKENFSTEYRKLVRGNSGHFDRIIKGQYHEFKTRREEKEIAEMQKERDEKRIKE